MIPTALILYVSIVLFGLCLGSFATAVIYRMPRGISLWRRASKEEKSSKDLRSNCPHCKHVLGGLDLVPLLSWLVLKGKCRYCKAPIGWVYVIAEALTLGLVLSFALFLPILSSSYVSLVLFALIAPLCVSIIFIDLKYKIIPDVLNLFLALLAILCLGHSSFVSGASYGEIQTACLASVLGAGLYGGFSFLLRWVFIKLMKKEPMGLGDVKFFTVAGLWLGVTFFPYFLFIAGFGGVFLGLGWKKLTGEEAFPFGPALVVSFVFCLFLKYL